MPHMLVEQLYFARRELIRCLDGLSDEDAFSSIRFGLGRFTSRQDIDVAIDRVVTAARKARRSDTRSVTA